MRTFTLRVMLMIIIFNILAVPSSNVINVFSYINKTNESNLQASEIPSEVESKKNTDSSSGDSKIASLDYGDAPGYTPSKIAVDSWSDTSSAPAFYLGFDRASFDVSNYRQEANGLGDDQTASSMSAPSSFYDPYSTDDETGFVYKTQDNNGKLNFSKSQPISLTVPYENTRNYSGNILLWIDFDGNKVYDADEGVMKSIRPGQSIGSYNPPDGGKYYNSFGVYNYFRNSEVLEITPPSGTVDDTFMRVVLTNDSSVTLDDGNLETYPGVGEIEEYPVHFYTTSSTCSVAKTLNDPKMSYQSVDEQEQKITYRGVYNPSDGVSFDIEVAIDDPGSTNNTRIDATRDYPLENYGSRNEGVLVTPQIINTNYTGSAKVTVSTYYANTKTPYPVPLQFTINDMDGDSGSHEYIENISDMVSYKMESDSNVIISHDMQTATYNGKNIDNAVTDGHPKEDFNAVSAQKFSYTTSNASVHTFNIGRSSNYAFGQFPMQISFPSDLPPNCKTGDTVIDKSIAYESISEDGIFQEGEVITYQVKVKNNTSLVASDVVIRDSLLENLPSGFSEYGSVQISPSVITEGNLSNGNFTINSINPSQEVTLTYKIKYDGSNSGGQIINNIVTDDGSNPASGACTPSSGYQDNMDCEQVVVSGEEVQDEYVQIDKRTIAQSIANDDNFSTNEQVTYEIAIKNTSASSSAHNIRVRDSLLIDMPNGISLVDGVNVSPSNIKYSGSLEDDNFEIDELAPQSEVKIVYTLTYSGGLNNAYRVTNIASDDGSDPTDSACVPSNGYKQNIDCEEISIHNVDSATVSKTVSDKGNEIAEPGEYLYYTITETSTYDSIRLVDTFDQNLDPSSIKITSVTENGVPLNTDNYFYTTEGNKLTITIPERTMLPGATYQIKYQAKVRETGLDVTDGSIDNKVVDTIPNSKPSDEASIPAFLNAKDTLTKTVADFSGDSYAQAGEKLVYSIEYKTSINREYIQIVDKLDDVNLNHIASNVRVYEDDVLLNNSRYTFLGSDTVIISGIKANTDYTIVFDTYVQTELDTSQMVIKNTVSEVVSGTSNEADIALDKTPVTELAKISKSVIESPYAGENNGNNIAEPGEYLHYEIDYTSNVSKELMLIDWIDINLELSSLTNVKLVIDGEEIDSSNYNITTNAHYDTIVFSNIDYNSNQKLVLSYDLKVADMPKDESQTVITNVVKDLQAGVSDSAEIAYKPTKPINGPETLTKEVIGSSKVEPGNNARYRLTIHPLQNEADMIEIIDKLENDYLTFVAIDNVYVNGIKTTDYTSNSSSYVDVTINRDFKIGDYVEVEFSAKLSEDTPNNITIQNKARGFVDEVQTNTDVAIIGTGSVDIAADSKVYTEKTIISEAGGGINDQLEPLENITYEIMVENISEDPLTVVVEDDLISQELENVYRWNEDDLVEIISEDGGVIRDTTMSELQSGLTLQLSAGEKQYVRYRLSGKSVLEEMDVNPADGDPDLEALNVAKVTPIGMDSLYPGVEIGLPHMNGELAIVKNVITADGDQELQPSPDEFMEYTITVINYGVNEAQNIFVSDDLYGQYFDSIVDLDSFMDQELKLSKTGGGTFVKANPTIYDLTSEQGVEVKIPPGDYISFSFRLSPRDFDFGHVDINDDGIEDTEIINTAILNDKTTGAEYSASSGVYFIDASLVEIDYLYTDENQFGELIEGFDMMNKINFVANQNISYLSGYISYDNRYLNDVRSDSFEVYVDDKLISTPISVEYIRHGNTTSAHFTIEYPITKGQKVEIINYQPPKDSLYNNTSLNYSINEIKLITESQNSDAYFSAFALK